jgi:hypothetical protein
MKFFAATIVATALLTSPAALQDFWQQHKLNARATEAGKALVFEYVRTPSEQLHIVSAYAQTDGSICVILTSEGPDPASVRFDYAVFYNDKHRTFEYGLDKSDFNGRCEGTAAGSNLLPAVERGVQKGEVAE